MFHHVLLMVIPTSWSSSPKVALCKNQKDDHPALLGIPIGIPIGISIGIPMKHALFSGIPIS